MLGASREEGHPSRSTPLRSGRGWVLHSQASAHVARHEVVSGRSATRLKNAEPGGAGRNSGGLRRRTQRPGESRRFAPWHGRTGSKESTRPRNARTRKEVIRRAARRAPDGGADRRGSPGWVARKGTTARHVTDDSPAWGEGSELEHRFVPARLFQVAESGIEHLLLIRARKQSGELARGGQPGRVARHARGAAPSEKGRRTGGRRLGSWQAALFTGRGGSGLDPRSITQTDLRWRRRDFGGDGASEAMSCVERDSDRGSGVEKTPPTRREGENPSSSPHGPPKRVQSVVKRRILRSHRSQGRTKQVGNRGRGYRSGR